MIIVVITVRMMSKLISPQNHVGFSVLLLCLAHSLGAINSKVVGESKVRCIETERQALLKIKENLHSKNDSLSSWGPEEEKRECCEWLGVRCASRSGHVIRLDLSPSARCRRIQDQSCYFDFEGNFSSALLELKYLVHLDLSFITFDQEQIPGFIGGLLNLRYLNLSNTLMRGEVPPQLGNLSGLEVLDLGSTALSIKSFDWISHLSSLRQLLLDYIYLSEARDWMLVVTKLPYLTHLHLRNCGLPDFVPSYLSFVNSSKSLTSIDLYFNSLSRRLFPWLFNSSHSLVHLDLGYNALEGPIPEDFGKMSSLKYLNLGYDKLKGFVPKALGNMTSLVELYLDDNMLEGEIPKSIWSICALRIFAAGFNNFRSGQFAELSNSSSSCAHYRSLEYLNSTSDLIGGPESNLSLFSALEELSLPSNQLTGTLPESIGELANLKVLDLSDNFQEGFISEAHFAKLSKLRMLDLSSNRFIFNIRQDWIPPFQLEFVLLSSCKLGPQFPKWLQHQKNYSNLDISNSGISDSVPNWFWDFSAQVRYLNLSENQITGAFQNSSFTLVGLKNPLRVIDLSSNLFQGSIPSFLFPAKQLDLSGNLFTKMNSMCDVSNEDAQYLGLIDVSTNQLSGELPDCWSYFSNLDVLILSHNKLAGEIPQSIGSLTAVKWLHLDNNSFTADLPSTLKNCEELIDFDAGGNKLSGPIPKWMGENLKKLVILSLRANNFHGNIPLNLCHLTDLQLLDLSSNDLSGNISRCLSNFTAMKETGSIGIKGIFYPYRRSTNNEFYADNLQLQWKGKLSTYESTLNLLRSIDLSSNNLRGEIPKEISELIGIISLNLSRNNLTGPIPPQIGQLKSLDAFDLSNNKLSGSIPSSLSQVDRLGVLDLSNNNLSGKIPTGPQLQNRDFSSYVGNPGLCGTPLPTKCPGDQESTDDPKTTDQDQSTRDQQDGIITRGFFISIGLGFVVGFWGVCGTLIFNRSWRYGYFRLLNDAGDWIYVMAAVGKAKLLRMIRG